VDAHVRVTDWALPLFLRYGVTTVRDVHNDPRYILPLAADDRADQPRIVAAGAALDGARATEPGALPISTLVDVRPAVRGAIEAGADVIAVSIHLHQALIAAVVEEAEARGVPVAAELGQTTATEAAAAGVASIERLSGIAEAASNDPDRLRRAHDEAAAGWLASEREWLQESAAQLEPVAQALVARDVAIVPALAVRDAYARLNNPTLPRGAALAGVPADVLGGDWNPRLVMARAHWTSDVPGELQEVLTRQQQFVAQFARLGGRIVSGTDAPSPFVVPGLSLHRELQLYVAAGLSPAAALRTATIDAARLLGVESRTGTIDVGKDADFVLLDGDPLSDIRATTRIALVARAGRVVYRRDEP